LRRRGLNGVEFVVADDHAGLRSAVREVYWLFFYNDHGVYGSVRCFFVPARFKPLAREPVEGEKAHLRQAA
jgi:hypothetical protein